MARRNFGEDVAQELAGKALIWVPAIAGAVLLGPPGILLGLVTTGAIIASGNDNSTPPPGGDPAKK